MKSYTNLEQSKKLAEILPVESADMFYNEEPDETYPKDIVDTKYPMVIREGQKHYLEEYGIPCWSLAALLGILPETIEDEYGEYDLEIDMIYKKPEYVRLCDCHHCDFPSWDWDNEELLDNIVEAVIWLNNNNYL